MSLASGGIAITASCRRASIEGKKLIRHAAWKPLGLPRGQGPGQASKLGYGKGERRQAASAAIHDVRRDSRPQAQGDCLLLRLLRASLYRSGCRAYFSSRRRAGFLDVWLRPGSGPSERSDRATSRHYSHVHSDHIGAKVGRVARYPAPSHLLLDPPAGQA